MRVPSIAAAIDARVLSIMKTERLAASALLPGPSGERIAVRYLPPTCSGMSQYGTVYPVGPHHCFTSAQSVHARHTNSRGALNVRVIINSVLIKTGCASAISQSSMLQTP